MRSLVHFSASAYVPIWAGLVTYGRATLCLSLTGRCADVLYVGGIDGQGDVRPADYEPCRTSPIGMTRGT